jgi:hypothetical protein
MKIFVIDSEGHPIAEIPHIDVLSLSLIAARYPKGVTLEFNFGDRQIKMPFPTRD